VEVIQVNIPGRDPRPFHHRGTRADVGVVKQIFESRDYALEPLPRGPEIGAVYDRLVALGRTPLIVDAGANIGASVVYFSLTFPAAHVVALEPEKNNFELMLRNVAGLDVDARCAAIGSTTGQLYLIDPGKGEWGYRTVKEPRGEPVPVCAAAALIEEKTRGGYQPFIVKIDIEGGEEELFSRNVGWIDAFPLLIIELHDWLLPRSGSSRNFLRCMAERDRDFVYFGENVFSFRNDTPASGPRA
jgi:FkbM family methyltransferase